MSTGEHEGPQQQSGESHYASLRQPIDMTGAYEEGDEVETGKNKVKIIDAPHYASLRHAIDMSGVEEDDVSEKVESSEVTDQETS